MLRVCRNPTLAARLVTRVAGRHVPFAEAKLLRVYGRLVTRSDTTLGVLVERGDAVVGVMLAEVGEYFLGSGGQTARSCMSPARFVEQR